VASLAKGHYPAGVSGLTKPLRSSMDKILLAQVKNQLATTGEALSDLQSTTVARVEASHAAIQRSLALLQRVSGPGGSLDRGRRAQQDGPPTTG
jgi:hypothetical protein